MSGRANDYPTPESLREDNLRYAQIGKPPPVDDTGNPLPYPPSTSKEELLSSVDFTAIDNHAITAPVSFYQGPLEELVSYLCESASSELLKVRVIWRWIAEQKFEELDESNDGPVYRRLDGLLDNISAYDKLFVDMCSLAGMLAILVEGLQRFGNFDPTVSDLGIYDAYWSAVKINNEWRLCHMRGSTGVVAGNNPGWTIIDQSSDASPNQPELYGWIFALNEECFLTDPERMIFSYFPQDDGYQLLHSPVTKDQFRNMAKIEGEFMDIGLKLLSHKSCLVHVQQDSTEISLSLPECKFKFNYILWRASSTEGSHISFERYVFMQQKQNGQLVIKICFPESGKYKLEIQGPYAHLCTYILVCHKVAAWREIAPLPVNPRQEWGPGVDLEEAGLVAVSHKEAIVETNNGTVDIKLTSDRPVEVHPELYSNTIDKLELEPYVAHEIVDNDVTIQVRLPEPGQYALHLHSRNRGKDPYRSVCCYLLEGDMSSTAIVPFPNADGYCACVTPAGNRLGVKCTSHFSALIKAKRGGEVEIVLDQTTAFALWGFLTQRVAEPNAELNRCSLSVYKDNMIHFKLKFPAAGKYDFRVYNATDLENVSNFIIDAETRSDNLIPFPKTIFPQYAEQRCDISPITGFLLCRTSIPFEVKIADAINVAVKIGPDWQHLDKGDDDRWSGDIMTGDAGSRVIVAAMMTDDASTFEFFARYDVVTQVEYEKASGSRPVVRERVVTASIPSDIDKTKQMIQEALLNENLHALQRLCQYAEEKTYIKHMADEIERARALIAKLKKIDAFKKALADILRFSNPPKIVHDVMRAALLLLGCHEGRSKNWKECNKICISVGVNGLATGMIDYDPSNLSQEIALRAHEMLSVVQESEVDKASKEILLVYGWTLDVVKECLPRGNHNIKSADRKRQKKIFSR